MPRNKSATTQQRMLDKARERAKKQGVPCTLVLADIKIPTHCPALGILLTASRGKQWTDNSPSLDRIVPERGYVPGNVVVISMRANRIKLNADPVELDRVAKFAFDSWPAELRWRW
jgi:hypothetical protein